jgi:PAS domain S-box-containing protein
MTDSLYCSVFAQQILDSSDDCIKTLDLEGRILFMSRGGQALLGIQDITPFLNTSWSEFWQGEDQQAAIEAIAKARAGEVGTFQGYRPTLNGEPKWWDSKVSPIWGAEGHVEYLLCISRDITERRLSEENRKQAEENLRQAAEFNTFRLSLNDALRPLADPVEIQSVASHLLGEYLGANRVAYFEVRGTNYVVERDYASGVEALAGDYAIDSFGPKLLAAYRAGHTVVVADVEADSNLSTAQRSAYRAIEIGSYIGIPLVKNGEFVAGLAVHMFKPRQWTENDVALAEEVAERTWAAVDRARAEAAVAADLKDTKLLRDLSARLVSETDSQVLYDEILVTAVALMQADAGSFQILDDETQELLLLATQSFSPTMSEQLSRVNTLSNTSCGIALMTQKRSIVDFDVSEHDDPNGHRRLYVEAGLLSAQSTPLMSRSGKLIGLVSTHWRKHHRPTERELRFLDLLARQAADLIEQQQTATEREQLLAREQAAREEAQNANRIKDEFLAVLSHELRSPLSPILGWAKLLQNGVLDTAKTQHALETIERNAHLQAELIEDLLDVSRILQGKLNLNVTSVNLVGVIRAAMETVQLAAKAKSIKVKTSFAPDVGLVAGDATRLQQVIWNLLSNAIKFTPSGGHVSVQLERLNSRAYICVSDTGQGIAPEFLPYVFDYFRQSDATTTRKFGGLGLGLAIVRHLVELHGGTVGVKSPGVGMGATFTIKLPLMSHQLTPEPEMQPSCPPLNLNSLKILVVEDDESTREFVNFLLNLHGATVTAVALASEALAVLPQFHPDVLLSDIGMPEMDGYTLMRQVRALPPCSGGNVPAIALTAYAGDFNQQRALQAGFQQHVAKPIEPERLIQVISSLLEPVVSKGAS